MEKIGLRVLFYFVTAISAVFLTVRWAEGRMLFFPSREMAGTPADIGVADFADVRFTSEDRVELTGWFVPAPGARWTVLFFHGNAGNISHRLEKIKILRELGASVFIIDYRGYGRSGGKPSEAGVALDADAAYRYLTEQLAVGPEAIVVYGESLGGAVATELAVRRPVRALVLESAFTSVQGMAEHAFSFAPRYFLTSRFDSLAKIPQVRTDKLVIHSVNDEIVPYHMGAALFEAAAEPKKLVQLKGGHNTCHVDSEGFYRAGLREFFASLTVAPRS